MKTIQNSEEKAKAIDTALKLQKIQEAVSRNESRGLARISRFIMSTWDLLSILTKTKHGESIVIDSEGNVFRGRVNTEKLQALPGKVSGFKNNDFDAAGLQEFFTTKSYVNSPAPTFKNAWEGSVKPPKNIDSPILEEWMEKINHLSPEDIVTINKVTKDMATFLEITIEGFPITVGIFEKTGTAYYYIFQGKRHELR